jgi:hypothetical protein
MFVFGFFGKGKERSAKLRSVKPSKSYPIEAVLGKGEKLQKALAEWAARYRPGFRKAPQKGFREK